MSIDYRICRVCLTPENKVELTSFFNENSEIALKVFLLSGIKITEFISQQVPALICFECLNDIRKSYELRRKCIESHSYFKEILTKVEHELWNEEFKNISQFTVKIEPNDYNFLDEETDFKLPDIPTFQTKNEIYKDFCIIENVNKTLAAKLNQNKPKSAADKNKINSTCKFCNKTFCSPKNMRLHRRAIHEKVEEADMLKCNKCDRSFKMKYQLNRHMKSAHQTPEEKAEEQARKLREMNEDDIFKKKLQGFSCTYCNKFFKYRQSLKDHITIKHEFNDISDRFLCDICGKEFLVKYYLKRHVRTAHLKTYVYKRKKTQSLPCSICGKVMASNSNLSAHEKTHKVLKPEEYWYCDLCGNKFKGRGEMSSHIKRIHLYNISYPCELCPGRSFRKLFQLERHVKVFHHNIRDFKCEWCGKAFGDNNRLSTHVRIHTGEQRYHCKWPGCDRKYTHQTDLRRHMWGHTGHRPFKCTVPGCSMGFMKKSELLAHENRSHPFKNQQAESSSRINY